VALRPRNSRRQRCCRVSGSWNIMRSLRDAIL